MSPTDLPAPPRRPLGATRPRLASLRTIGALVLREMSSTYGRSPGGYVWAILEPALGLTLLVAIFALGFRTPPLGSNFAIFYASGLLPFFVFTTTVAKVQQAVNYSRQLLGYPRVTFLDAILARFALNLLTQLSICAILFAVIFATGETRTVLRPGPLLNAFSMAAALGLGMGTVNCLLISRQPIWNTVWAVVSRPLVLVSGVIILHESVPQPYRAWLEWNPLVHVTGEARHAFYYSYHADYVSSAYVYGVAGAMTVIGLLFLRRYTRDLLER